MPNIKLYTSAVVVVAGNNVVSQEGEEMRLISEDRKFIGFVLKSTSE